MSNAKMSVLAETLQASEIVRLGATIKEKIKLGGQIYNYTIGDFDAEIFPIPAELEEEIINAYKKRYTTYPAAEGNLDLREAVSSFILHRLELNYAANEILIAAGGRIGCVSFFISINNFFFQFGRNRKYFSIKIADSVIVNLPALFYFFFDGCTQPHNFRCL